VRRILRNGRSSRPLVPEHENILDNPYIAGKVLSSQDRRGYIIIRREAGDPPSLSMIDGLPIPPTDDLRLRYGASPEDYVASGQRDVEAMLDVLKRGGIPADAVARVLEVGCGAGRMLRHVHRLLDAPVCWGVDISAAHITWCQQHLTPPLFFATTTTAPHLPFEDNSFDLVYCGSLFTHISDLADAWFLEVQRVLRPGGCAYITIHDEHIIRWLLSEEGRNDRWMASLSEMLLRFDATTSLLSSNYQSFSIAADAQNQVQVFYDSAALIAKWSAWATFVSSTPGAYARQTALLFTKRMSSRRAW
jgi:ubiquinone/menaquinone biosynthesis C-methylase UbiE